MAFNLGDIFVKFKATSEGFEKVVSTLQNASKKAGDVADKMGAWGEKAEKTGKSMTLSLTTPIVGFGAAAFKLSADFDTSMRQVQAATGAPAESLKSLSELATKMGADTVFSANDAAQAMLELAKGGMTEAQIKAGALSATMTLAAAGGLELASAAGYISNALNTFNLDASEADKVAAALAGGANASSASVESLGLALSQVGPGARLAGYTLQETVAVLAAFDNAGVKGSDAGTSFKTMLMNLSPQTKEARKEMEKLGLKFTDAKGQFIPIRDVAEQLKTKMKGLTDEQKTNALTTMFGTDAYRAAAILMNEGAAGVDKYAAATNDSTAAQKMADAAMGGANGKWEAMKGSIETATKALGDAAAPAVMKLMGGITKLANKIGELTPKTQKLVVGFLAIVAAAGPSLIILGKMAQGFKTAKDGVALLGKASVKSFGMISKAVTLLAANPAVLIWMGVIVAIAAIAYLVYRNWDTLKRWFGTFWNWMKNTASSVFEWFKRNWKVLITILMGPVGLIIALIATYWNQIMAVLNAIWLAIQGVWNAIVIIFQVAIALIVGYIMALIQFWTTIFHPLWLAMQAVWNLIIIVIQKAIMIAQTIAVFFVNILASIFNGIWLAMQAVWNVVVAVINGAWQIIFGIVSWAVGIVISIFNGIWQGIQWVFQRAWDLAKGIWNQASSFFSAIVDGIKGVFGRIADAISGPFKTAFNAISRFWNSTVGKLDFHAPDWVPGMGGKGFSMPKLPELAEGGVLMPRRGGVPFIGAEAGSPEAVIPLKKLPELAKQMGIGGEGNGGVQIQIDGAFARNESELVDLFESALEMVDRKRRAQGKTALINP